MIEKKLIINKNDSETRIALLENGRLAEIFIERERDKSIVGNIYKGNVVRVLPGMNSAFVDIGLDKSAFLFGGDSYSPDHPHSKYLSPEEQENGTERVIPQITEILSDGQDVIVQIAKEPIGTKGPRVTMHLTIAGRYLVLMPYSQHIALSRRIEDEHEKKRLTNIASKLFEQNQLGVIVRTAAQGISKESINRDFNLLKKQWEQLLNKITTTKPPELIYQELNLVKKTTRDFFDEGIKSIIIDDFNTYQQLRSFFAENIPEAFKHLQLYTEPTPIFDIFGIEVDMSRALGKKIELPSGGYLIIEQTEALTTFDVNTGKYVGKVNAQQTILKTNLEACIKVVEQLRIRNIGGIIIIDFIDMESEEDRQKVFENFSEEISNDRALTNVLPMTELGLLQLTRKRIKESLGRKLLEPCPHCQGLGQIRNVHTEALDLLREIIRQSVQTNSKEISAHVRADIMEWIEENEKKLLKKISEDQDLKISFSISKLNMNLLRELPFDVITQKQ